MRPTPFPLFVLGLLSACVTDAGELQPAGDSPYPIIDSGQVHCYGAVLSIDCGAGFDGQDGQYEGWPAGYADNGDGTVTDVVTGLMWQQSPGAKVTADAADADGLVLAGHDDWRLPSVKELYSLVRFSGTDPSSCGAAGSCDPTPFIDDSVFDFAYGDEAAGERLIDAQWATSTRYVDSSQEQMFGVNFADGRIKGYPTGPMPGQEDGKLFFALHVRGNAEYGVNALADNGDGTITDEATGLTWLQQDSGHLGAGALGWEEALRWAEDLDFAGHDDWRLPSAKELQSIVDYDRSPATDGTAAIDPLFQASPITDEGGGSDFGFYWTSTTHADVAGQGGSAIYVAFGRALGWMQDPMTGEMTLMDVHGAGAQRSDPKVGDPADTPLGHGPQGDVIRIYNLVRPVRGGTPGDRAGLCRSAAGRPCRDRHGCPTRCRPETVGAVATDDVHLRCRWPAALSGLGCAEGNRPAGRHQTPVGLTAR